MSVYFRTERKAREDAILSVRDDVVGNLTPQTLSDEV